MNKTKNIIALILIAFVAVLFYRAEQAAERAEWVYEGGFHPDDFTWKIEVIKSPDEYELYYTNHDVLGMKMDSSAYHPFMDIHLERVYKYESSKWGWRLVGPVDEPISLEHPMIITERVDNHEVHEKVIHSKRDQGDSFWRLAVRPYSDFKPTVWTTQMPIQCSYTNRLSKLVTVNYPYLQFGTPENGNGIMIYLIKSITFVNVGEMIKIPEFYDEEDRIWVFHFTKDKSKSHMAYRY